MAKYRLTGPDGKVYTVNAPDNASNEDLVNFVKQQSGVPGIGLGGTQDPAGATQNDLLNASSQYAAGGQPAPEHVPHAARAEAHPYMDDQGITYNSDGVAQPYQVKPGGSRDDFGRMITHAIHHGFAAGYDEELASGAKALGQYVRGEKLSFNEAYDQNLAAYRDQAKALREAYPKTSLGTTIAAGAMVPLGSLGLAGKGGGALKNIWTGAKVGGAYGALSGFGDGEGGFANRLDSARVGAEWGAGLGAGLGVVAPVVAKGIMDYALPAARAVGRAPGQVVSKIADQFGGLPQSVQKVVNDPRNAALARLSVIAERSAKEATPGGLGQPGDPRGMTGAHIIGKLGQVQKAADFGMTKAGAPLKAEVPVSIGDMDQVLRRELRRIHTLPGQGSATIDATLNAKAIGTHDMLGGEPRDLVSSMANPRLRFSPQSQQVSDAAALALGLPKGHSATEYGNKVISVREKNAKPMYDMAYKNEKGFDLRPALQDAMADISQLAPADQKQMIAHVQQFFDVDGAGNPVRLIGDTAGDLRKFQFRKQRLDDAIATAKIENPTFARILTKLKKEAVAAVDLQNTLYKSARQRFSGLSDLKDAADLGRRALLDGHEIAADAIKGMTQGEKHAFRVGILGNIQDVLDGKIEGADMTALFRKASTKKLLNVVMGQPYAAKLARLIETHSAIASTRNTVLGGSQTADKAAEVLDPVGASRAAWQLAGGNPKPVIEWVATKMYKIFGPGEAARLELARILLETNPAKIRRIAMEMDRKFGRGTAKIVKQLAAQAAANPAIIRGVATYGAQRPSNQSPASP